MRRCPASRTPTTTRFTYIVSGQSWLDLGGDPESGDGAQAYRVEPGMVVVIPAGTFHRLRNDTDTDLVILTIWPQPQRTGANKLHEKRRQTWGTGFKLRQGRELVNPRLLSKMRARTDGQLGARPCRPSSRRG